MPHPPCPSSVEPLGARRKACPPLCLVRDKYRLVISASLTNSGSSIPVDFSGARSRSSSSEKTTNWFCLDFVTFHDLVRRNLFAYGISDPLESGSWRNPSCRVDVQLPTWFRWRDRAVRGCRPVQMRSTLSRLLSFVICLVAPPLAASCVRQPRDSWTCTVF